MTTVCFTENYLEDIPVDLQMKICDMSKSRWRLNCDNLDNDKFHTYMLNMIKKDRSSGDTNDTIMELQKKLSFSNVSFQFANQKLSEAINDVLKYQDEFDFDLHELLSKITIEEQDLGPSFLNICRNIYDWNLNEYVTNPDYKPDKDWEYSSDEEE